jgi:hypothetical protein
MSLIENERTKLGATLLNGLAVATAAAGVIVPVISAFYGLGNSPQWRLLLAGIPVWLAAGAALHLAGRRILGGMK